MINEGTLFYALSPVVRGGISNAATLLIPNEKLILYPGQDRKIQIAQC